MDIVLKICKKSLQRAVPAVPSRVLERTSAECQEARSRERWRQGSGSSSLRRSPGGGVQV